MSVTSFAAASFAPYKLPIAPAPRTTISMIRATVTRVLRRCDAKHFQYAFTENALYESKRFSGRVCRKRTKMRDLRKRSARFVVTSHPLKNVREQNILTRLVRLAIDCAPLHSVG